MMPRAKLTQHDTSSIRGFVTTYKCNNPIAGALIEVTQEEIKYSTTTDSEGKYAILRLSIGSYTITPRANGYKSVSMTGWLGIEELNLNFILDTESSPTLADVVVYPNPFKADKHNVITFGHPKDQQKRLPEIAEIRIYNIAGELVKTIREPDDDGVSDGIATWYADNNSGKKVASGVYIYTITSPYTDKRCIGKIAIIR